MMTRVNKTSVGVSAMLLAVLLLVGGTSMPAFAKEDISAGQAGDPGDGLDFSSGGSTDGILDGAGGSDASGGAGTGLRAPVLFGIRIVLVPYFDASGLRFAVINIANSKAESPK